MGLDRTQQDKIGQEAQVTTGQDKTGQDRRGQDITGQDKTGQDKTGGNKVEKGELRRFKAGPGRAAQDTTDDLKTRCTKNNQYEERSETV